MFEDKEGFDNKAGITRISGVTIDSQVRDISVEAILEALDAWRKQRRMELQYERTIVKEGIERGVRFQEVNIYSRFNPVRVFVTVVNNKRSNWASRLRIERLIDDMMPMERPYEIRRIALANHGFEEEDIVEVYNLWFSRSEDDDEEDIQMLSGSRDWGCGWIQGKIVKVNRGCYYVGFAREVYFTRPSGDAIFTSTREVEESIECGELKLLKVGKLLRIGCHSWQIRLVD